MTEMQFCQSCAMPLNPEVQGTEADGSPSADYCHYCYKNGAFTAEATMTMEQMIDVCVPYTAKATGKSEAEVRAEMQQYFPQLKRWKK